MQNAKMAALSCQIVSFCLCQCWLQWTAHNFTDRFQFQIPDGLRVHQCADSYPTSAPAARQSRSGCLKWRCCYCDWYHRPSPFREGRHQRNHRSTSRVSNLESLQLSEDGRRCHSCRAQSWKRCGASLQWCYSCGWLMATEPPLRHDRSPHNGARLVAIVFFAHLPWHPIRSRKWQENRPDDICDHRPKLVDNGCVVVVATARVDPSFLF
jgi:hypothetical protein